MLETKPI